MVYECGLRLAERLKSGGPSLGRSPDAHKQRRLVNQDQTQFFEVKGSTQFLSRAPCPALFFLRCSFLRWLFLQSREDFPTACAPDDRVNQSDRAKLRDRRQPLRGSDAAGV